MEFVEIPAGKFWMGWESGLPCEGPRHPVLVDAFAIAKTPVTIAEYSRFIEATSAAPPPLGSLDKSLERQENRPSVECLPIIAGAQAH